MIHNQIDKFEYKVYLVQQLALFECIEQVLYEAANRDTRKDVRVNMDKIYTVSKALSRVYNIHCDLDNLEVVDIGDYKDILTSTMLHIERMKILSTQKPLLLTSHVLILYLALLNGGSALKMIFSEFPTSIYDFESPEECKRLLKECLTCIDGEYDKAEMKNEAELVYKLVKGSMIEMNNVKKES
jgi:heme oxygenase